MQVFKAFFKIQKNHIKGTLIYVFVFLALSAGLSFSGEKETVDFFSQTSIKFAVDNTDQGELGEELVSYLEQRNEKIELKDSKEAMMDAIFNRAIDYALLIPKDFTKNITNRKKEKKDLMRDLI